MDPSEAFGNNPEVLSQADVERLLAQVAEQEAATEVLQSGGRRLKHTPDAIQPYDFRQPVFLAAGELRKLRLRQEEFTRSLAARLSIYLRMEFGLQLSRLQTVTYQKFIENLSSPSHLSLFKTEPLRGVGILDIPTQLGVTMVDRLMGGPAHAMNLERDLSDIEAALLDQAVQVILQEWCNQWAGFHELRPVVLGHESSGRFLQTAPHDTIMLVLAMEARLGDCQEPIQMGFPCYTLEPLMRRLSADLETNTQETRPAAATPPQWRALFNEMPVHISASWHGLELTARHLSQLRVGEVLALNAEFAQQIQVQFAHIPKFMGCLGQQDNKLAVELTRVFRI